MYDCRILASHSNELQLLHAMLAFPRISPSRLPRIGTNEMTVTLLENQPSVWARCLAYNRGYYAGDA